MLLNDIEFKQFPQNRPEDTKRFQLLWKADYAIRNSDSNREWTDAIRWTVDVDLQLFYRNLWNSMDRNSKLGQQDVSKGTDFQWKSLGMGGWILWSYKSWMLSF